MTCFKYTYASRCAVGFKGDPLKLRHIQPPPPPGRPSWHVIISGQVLLLMNDVIYGPPPSFETRF